MFFISFLLPMTFVNFGFDREVYGNDDDLRARAILEAVAEVRTMDRFHIEIEIETKLGKLVYRIKSDSNNGFVHLKRFDDGELTYENKALILGDAYYLFANYSPEVENKDHYSVKLDKFEKNNTSLDLKIIKPGLVGLTAVMANLEDVRDSLRLTGNNTFTLEKSTTKNGNSVSIIKSEGSYSNVVYEVEDSTLRLLKVAVEHEDDGYYLRQELYSSYSGDNKFPNNCVIIRSEKNLPPRERKVSLKFLPLNFDDSAFELSSLEMPLGTSCTDYRINTIIGYWNGKEFIDDFYESIRAQPEMPSSSPYTNIALVLLVLIMTTLTLIYLKKSANK